MARYDVENLINDARDIVLNNLNAKLQAINDEKADDLTLMELAPENVFFQDLSHESAVAAPLFLFYGLDDPQADGLGPATALKYELFFILVVQDTGETKNFLVRCLRYMRAMQEIFQENYDKIPRAGRLSVSSLAPVSFAIDGGGSYKATGVKVRAALA